MTLKTLIVSCTLILGLTIGSTKPSSLITNQTMPQPLVSPLVQPVPSTSLDPLTWCSRYPIHLCAATAAGAVAYHFWNLDENKIKKNNRIAAMGFCAIIGLAALIGQDFALRGVDYFAALKFIWDIFPQLILE